LVIKKNYTDMHGQRNIKTVLYRKLCGSVQLYFIPGV